MASRERGVSRSAQNEPRVAPPPIRGRTQALAHSGDSDDFTANREAEARKKRKVTSFFGSLVSSFVWFQTKELTNQRTKELFLVHLLQELSGRRIHKNRVVAACYRLTPDHAPGDVWKLPGSLEYE